MSGTVSADMLWMLTRSNSSFLVKRESGRIQYSADGKAKKNATGISLSTKSAKGMSCPSKLDNTTVCAKDFKRDFRRVAKCVKAHVSKTRSDLVKPALARWTKYHRALKRSAAKKA